MAVKAHVRAFVGGLEAAPPWDPRPLATRLVEDVPEDALADWVATVDGLRVGHGAVGMSRRHKDGPEAPTLKGVEDFEGLVLCAGALRLGRLVERGYHPDGDAFTTAVTEGGRWLTNLLRMEPDFFDELLLEVAARQASDAAFAEALEAQAEAWREAGAELHHQGQALLGGKKSVGDVLRGLVGAGPNLSKGAWAQWGRAVVVLGCLDAKG